MPSPDPEKRRAASRESMRRKRANPDALAEERKQKAVKRGGDRRASTEFIGTSGEDGKAAHGLVSRLSYNYGNAEGGKARRGDLQSVRVRRQHRDRDGRRGDFEPDEPVSDHHRTVRLARHEVRLDDDPLARAL